MGEDLVPTALRGADLSDDQQGRVADCMDRCEARSLSLDVAIVAIPPAATDGLASWPTPDPWPQDQHEIASGLFIGKLADERHEAIVAACARRGDTDINEAIGYHYAFWHEVPYGTPPVPWDSGGDLCQLMKIARLVRPHTGDSAAAAAVRWSGGRETITPVFGREMHPTDPADAWLRAEDIEQVRTLWQAWLASDRGLALPPRLNRALWFFEYQHFEPYVDVRWPLLGMVLETLVKVYESPQGVSRGPRVRSTEAFRRGGVALAELVCLDWSPEWLGDVYGMRSRYAHGQPGTVAGNVAPVELEMLIAFEEGLRTVLRQFLLEPLLRKVVSSDEAVASLVCDTATLV